MFRIYKAFGWTVSLSLSTLAISGCSMQGSAADGVRPASARQRTTPQQEFEAERDHLMSTGRAPIALPVETLVA